MKVVSALLLSVLVVAAAVAAPTAVAATGRLAPAPRFLGILTGAQEVPPVDSAGWGVVRARLQGSDLSISFHFAGLGSPVNTSIGLHIHEAPKGANGPILFPLTENTRLFKGDTAGRGRARVHLDDAQVTAVRAGTLYLNVHSVEEPAGELRAQLWPVGRRRRRRHD